MTTARFVPDSRKRLMIAAAVSLMALGLGCVGNQPASARTAAPAAPPVASAAPSASPRADGPPAQPLAGTVQSFNVNQRGINESLNLTEKDGRVVQIDFPPFMSAAVAQSAKVGQSISLTATPRMSMPDHPVYALATLDGPGNQKLIVSRPDRRGQTHVQGKIDHLNYDATGRVNGAVLDSGQVVLINSAAAARLNLQPAQTLQADGRPSAGPSGITVINAVRVNGTAVGQPRQMAGRMMAGRGGPDGGPNGGMMAGRMGDRMANRDGNRDGRREGDRDGRKMQNAGWHRHHHHHHHHGAAAWFFRHMMMSHWMHNHGDFQMDGRRGDGGRDGSFDRRDGQQDRMGPGARMGNWGPRADGQRQSNWQNQGGPMNGAPSWHHRFDGNGPTTRPTDGQAFGRHHFDRNAPTTRPAAAAPSAP